MNVMGEALKRRKSKGLAITISVEPNHAASEEERKDLERGSDLAPNPTEHDEGEGAMHPDTVAPAAVQDQEPPIHQMLDSSPMTRRARAAMEAKTHKKGKK